jgi:hypothetical protein
MSGKRTSKTIPVDSFARDAPRDINIWGAGFLDELFVIGKYRDIHMCPERIARMAAPPRKPIYGDASIVLIHICPKKSAASQLCFV